MRPPGAACVSSRYLVPVLCEVLGPPPGDAPATRHGRHGLALVGGSREERGRCCERVMTTRATVNREGVAAGGPRMGSGGPVDGGSGGAAGGHAVEPRADARARLVSSRNEVRASWHGHTNEGGRQGPWTSERLRGWSAGGAGQRREGRRWRRWWWKPLGCLRAPSLVVEPSRTLWSVRSGAASEPWVTVTKIWASRRFLTSII